MKGKGALLDDPTIPISQPVTVQLFNSDGVCWEATFSAPAQKNVAGQFKDKADSSVLNGGRRRVSDSSVASRQNTVVCYRSPP